MIPGVGMFRAANPAPQISGATLFFCWFSQGSWDRRDSRHKLARDWRVNGRPAILEARLARWTGTRTDVYPAADRLADHPAGHSGDRCRGDSAVDRTRASDA